MFKKLNSQSYFTFFICMMLMSFSHASSHSDEELELEKNRISKHLIAVEDSLRQRVIPHLSAEQQSNRISALDVLKEYIDLGQFPKNEETFTRSPIFKDKESTWCAVGYMLEKTGYKELAEKIYNENLFIQIDEIQDFEESAIGEWAIKYGFEQAELHMIQPRYVPPNKVVTAFINNIPKLYRYFFRYLIRTPVPQPKGIRF